MKFLSQIKFCVLIILIILLKKVQEATASNVQSNCTDHQYYQEKFQKCCSRCPPGTSLKRECNATSDTLCKPCEDGKYSSSWNYSPICRICRTCAKYLVEKEKCSPTKKEQCVCPEGYYCTQRDAFGVCLVCRPSEPQTSPVATVTHPTPVYPSWVIPTAFVITFAAVCVTLIIIYKTRKAWSLEKLGCMAKVKKPFPETTGVEVNIAPSQGLLLDKGLQFPVEETDASQSAEYALNFIHRHPI